MTSERYDPVMYVYHCFWRLKCLEAGFMEFQRLFEEVATRVGWQFLRIKPHGRHGDKKADGLFFVEGAVFQVYAPDEMKLKDTLKKIEDDLAGAVREWGANLKQWVFVYNDRRGLAPDIPALLYAERQNYPHISIDTLSADDMWKVVRDLPLRDRVEILGPPPGYEGIFPLTMAAPEEVQKRLRNSRFVVIQDILSPINIQDALRAMGRARPLAPPLFLRGARDSSWEVAADLQRRLVDEAIEESRERLPRFAVFSLAPIPLAIHLGFLLSDRVEVEPYQYDRDRRTWAWNTSVTSFEVAFEITGLPNDPAGEPVEVALRVSLSARVRHEQTAATVGRLPVEVDLALLEPDVMWLKNPDQLTAFAGKFRHVLSAIREAVPHCRQIHLFFAGPTGSAIVAGQAINPRMNPPVLLYEYSRQKTPPYEHVLTLQQ